MMNILFIIGKYPNYGGTEKITTVLANCFSKKGCLVAIASFEQPKPELASELDHRIKLIRLSYPVKSASNVKIIRKCIKENKIDVILNQWCLPFMVTQLINRARKNSDAKLISVLHGVPDRSKKLIVAEDRVKSTSGIPKLLNKIKLKLTDYVIRYSCKYVYDNSDKYVVLSDAFISSFSEYSGKKDISKLVAIGNPITIATDYSTDYLPLKKNRILYVGRLDLENKRVNRIIETWELIANKFHDWSLHLVGDGPHRSDLEQYVKTHKIKNVFFHGFIQEEPTEFYKESKILMLTSDLEGFGLVIVEAMSYGVVPVVYGSYSSVYDIIKSGEDGMITSPPFSKETTARVLSELIENEKRLQKLSVNAQDKSKTFDLESTIQQWHELFDVFKKHVKTTNYEE